MNCLAPTGATQMMEGILPEPQLARFKPELVSPAVLALVAESAPNRAILSAGAVGYELAYIALTQGIALGEGATAEQILSRWGELADRSDAFVPGMRERGWGRVVAVGTVGSVRPGTRPPQYYAAKGALVNLVVGVAVSIFQAVTQIQESTLSFVPKLLASFLILVLAGPWMTQMILDYSNRIFITLNEVAQAPRK